MFNFHPAWTVISLDRTLNSQGQVGEDRLSYFPLISYSILLNLLGDSCDCIRLWNLPTNSSKISDFSLGGSGPRRQEVSESVWNSPYIELRTGGANSEVEHSKSHSRLVA